MAWLILGLAMALLVPHSAVYASHGGTPNVTVTPNTGLNRAGQSVTVNGTGYAPGATVFVQQCRQSPSVSYCRGLPNATADGTGAFSSTATVDYTLNGILPSCEDPYCVIQAFTSSPNPFATDKTQIRFAGSSSTSATPSTSPPQQATVPLGTSVTDSAVVTGNAVLGSPTGTVSFFVCGPGGSTCNEGGAAVAGNPQPLTAGANNTASAVSAQFTPSTPGRYCFRATYSGDAGYGKSFDGNPSNCFYAKVASTTTGTPSKTWIPLGQSLTDSAVVTGNATGGTPTGGVLFYNCGPIAEPATCTSGGNLTGGFASLTAGPGNTATATSASITPNQPGRYCFRAEYFGDDRYQTSSDGSSTQCYTVGGYPRPRGATPARFSLVPAYRPCTSPDNTHGAPLSFPSCSAPALASDYLTLGTPDANGRGANGQGSLTMKVIQGDESTPADEADVRVDTLVTDVRRKSDLTDYAGELRARVVLRLTDVYSGTSLADTATVDDFPLSFMVPCTPTAVTNVGSTCSLSSTADAVLGDPDAAKEGKRAVWALDEATVFDGGADDLASSEGDNTLFMTQGVFVP